MGVLNGLSRNSWTFFKSFLLSNYHSFSQCICFLNIEFVFDDHCNNRSVRVSSQAQGLVYHVHVYTFRGDHAVMALMTHTMYQCTQIVCAMSCTIVTACMIVYDDVFYCFLQAELGSVSTNGGAWTLRLCKQPASSKKLGLSPRCSSSSIVTF